MPKYTSSVEFLNDLSVDYPEKVIILLEMDYTEEEILEYLEITTLEDFNVEMFRDSVETVRNNLLISSFGNRGISTNQIANPVTGELYLDQSTNSLHIYNGVAWITAG